MYDSFDPELMVTPARGKVFSTEAVGESRLEDIPGVNHVSFVLEESVLLEYRGRQTIGVLRGVDEAYDKVVPVCDLIVMGDYELRFGDMEQAVVGMGIAASLGVRTALYNPINVYSPRRGEFSALLPVDSYSTGRLYPKGIFALDKETDDTYILSSIEFAQELLDYGGQASHAMLALTPGANDQKVRKAIMDELGDGFVAKTRMEQKADMYRVMKFEKWAIFFIILLVLVIASFSIVGSLVMLIIDKRPDMRILMSMGADAGFVRRIFVNEGMLISCIGTVIGVAVGVLVCWAQQQFGLVKLAGATFLVESYPVEMRWEDILAVVAATLAVTWIITKFTVSRMIPKSSIVL